MVIFWCWLVNRGFTVLLKVFHFCWFWMFMEVVRSCVYFANHGDLFFRGPLFPRTIISRTIIFETIFFCHSFSLLYFYVLLTNTNLISPLRNFSTSIHFIFSKHAIFFIVFSSEICFRSWWNSNSDAFLILQCSVPC